MEQEVQTRNNDGELKYFSSVFEAFQYAESNLDVWKVSWTDETGKRVRFTRSIDAWLFRPMPVGILFEDFRLNFGPVV